MSRKRSFVDSDIDHSAKKSKVKVPLEIFEKAVLISVNQCLHAPVTRKRLEEIVLSKVRENNFIFSRNKEDPKRTWIGNFIRKYDLLSKVIGCELKQQDCSVESEAGVDSRTKFETVSTPKRSLRSSSTRKVSLSIEKAQESLNRFYEIEKRKFKGYFGQNPSSSLLKSPHQKTKQQNPPESCPPTHRKNPIKRRHQTAEESPQPKVARKDGLIQSASFSFDEIIKSSNFRHIGKTSLFKGYFGENPHLLTDSFAAAASTVLKSPYQKKKQKNPPESCPSPSHQKEPAKPQHQTTEDSPQPKVAKKGGLIETAEESSEITKSIDFCHLGKSSLRLPFNPPAYQSSPITIYKNLLQDTTTRKFSNGDLDLCLSPIKSTKEANNQNYPLDSGGEKEEDSKRREQVNQVVKEPQGFSEEFSSWLYGDSPTPEQAEQCTSAHRSPIQVNQSDLNCTTANKIQASSTQGSPANSIGTIDTPRSVDSSEEKEEDDTLVNQESRTTESKGNSLIEELGLELSDDDESVDDNLSRTTESKGNSLIEELGLELSDDDDDDDESVDDNLSKNLQEQSESEEVGDNFEELLEESRVTELLNQLPDLEEYTQLETGVPNVEADWLTETLKYCDATEGTIQDSAGLSSSVETNQVTSDSQSKRHSSFDIELFDLLEELVGDNKSSSSEEKTTNSPPSHSSDLPVYQPITNSTEEVITPLLTNGISTAPGAVENNNQLQESPESITSRLRKSISKDNTSDPSSTVESNSREESRSSCSERSSTSKRKRKTFQRKRRKRTGRKITSTESHPEEELNCHIQSVNSPEEPESNLFGEFLDQFLIKSKEKYKEVSNCSPKPIPSTNSSNTNPTKVKNRLRFSSESSEVLNLEPKVRLVGGGKPSQPNTMASSSGSDSESEARQPRARKRKRVSSLFLFSPQIALKEQNKILQENGQLREPTKILHQKVKNPVRRDMFDGDHAPAIKELGDKKEEHPLKHYNDRLFDIFSKKNKPPKQPKYRPEKSTSVAYVRPENKCEVELVEQTSHPPSITDDFTFDDKDGVLKKFASSSPDKPTCSAHQYRSKMIKIERSLHKILRVKIAEEEYWEKRRRMSTRVKKS